MTFGQAELERMLADRELEICPPDTAGARALVNKARRHHATAGQLAFADAEIAMGALHAGNRKALEAVLLARGLRPCKQGGHIAPIEAVRAMLGGQGRGVLSVYNVVRRARHEGDYASASTDVDPADIVDNLSDSEALVSACEKMLLIVTVFVPGR